MTKPLIIPPPHSKRVPQAQSPRVSVGNRAVSFPSWMLSLYTSGRNNIRTGTKATTAAGGDCHQFQQDWSLGTAMSPQLEIKSGAIPMRIHQAYCRFPLCLYPLISDLLFRPRADLYSLLILGFSRAVSEKGGVEYIDISTFEIIPTVCIDLKQRHQ